MWKNNKSGRKQLDTTRTRTHIGKQAQNLHIIQQIPPKALIINARIKTLDLTQNELNKHTTQTKGKTRNKQSTYNLNYNSNFWERIGLIKQETEIEWKCAKTTCNQTKTKRAIIHHVVRTNK